ncbi:hypothetical protein TSMEX_001549 [Taenia solium]|eukprot:TsM_000396600 transcript=TsM_000396600 gene=TsM_000396600
MTFAQSRDWCELTSCHPKEGMMKQQVSQWAAMLWSMRSSWDGVAQFSGFRFKCSLVS